MKTLTRSRDNTWIGGVCGGIGHYTDVDANLIRLAAVVLTILGFGTVVIAYLVAWLLIPRAGRTVTVVSPVAPTDPEPGQPSP
ncbi:MAG: PspC domain-containing protein [Aeromicrobium sp.]|uniref:PspC domain-containing protein n=1 Tax=Aeromicrobium sp. TaxID=1871063 RepID=UPI003C532BE3